MKKFLDVPAAARFSKLTLDNLPHEFGLNAFYDLDYWGSAEDVLEGALKKGHPFIKIGGVWQDNHQYNTSFSLAQKAANFAERMALKYPDQDIYFNVYIEHTLNDLHFLDSVHALAPNCLIVNNPGDYNGRSGSFSDTYLNEVHKGFSAIPPIGAIFSYDGKSIWNCNVKNDLKLYKPSSFGGWCSDFNMKTSDGDKTPRKDRTHKPTKATFKRVVNLMK